MRRTARSLPFGADEIAPAPSQAGVYFLFRDHRLIYIGLAAGRATLRGELQRHWGGEAGEATRAATQFEYDCTPDPEASYRYYLETYRLRSGGLLPPCNEKGGDQDRRLARGGSRSADPARQVGSPCASPSIEWRRED